MDKLSQEIQRNQSPALDRRGKMGDEPVPCGPSKPDRDSNASEKYSPLSLPEGGRTGSDDLDAMTNDCERAQKLLPGSPNQGTLARRDSLVAAPQTKLATAKANTVGELRAQDNSTSVVGDIHYTHNIHISIQQELPVTTSCTNSHTLSDQHQIGNLRHQYQSMWTKTDSIIKNITPLSFLNKKPTLINPPSLAISPDIAKQVLAAAKDDHNGRALMKHLLDQKTNNFIITEEVLCRAANNWGNGLEVMDLLLDRRGSTIQITEEVMKVAARNDKTGQNMVALLLDKKGAHITITQDILVAAARNDGNGEKVMRLLLHRRGSQVAITEEVLEAAANNWGNGREILTLLLNERGNEIKITEEVLEVAAKNDGNGGDVMKVLLDLKGDDIVITENVLKGAANNWGNGPEVMEVLLNWQGGEMVNITKRVRDVAAQNSQNGKEGMAVIRSWEERRSRNGE